MTAWPWSIEVTAWPWSIEVTAWPWSIEATAWSWSIEVTALKHVDFNYPLWSNTHPVTYLRK